jgi:hypothetical protein
VKKCSKCGEVRNIDDFHYRKDRKKHYAHCKFCHAKMQGYVYAYHPTRKCMDCGKEFVAKSQSNHFCSNKCCRKSNYGTALKDQIRRCIHCGTAFVPISSTKRCCSLECSRAYRINDNRQRAVKVREAIFKSIFTDSGWLVEPYKTHKTVAGYVEASWAFGVRMLEHRLVMARKMGRLLESHELVHHINGVKTDNRITNLELITPHGHRATEQLVSDYRNLKAMYVELEAKYKIALAKHKELSDTKTLEEAEQIIGYQI